MAKQIKVIKCPQCGSTKPEQLKQDHYRCDKCGTQFFLDNDDVNININHKHSTEGSGSAKLSKSVWIVFVLVMIALIFLLRLCSGTSRNDGSKPTIYRTYANKEPKQDKYLAQLLLSVRGEGLVFCLENKDTKEPTYGQFRKLTTGEIVAEKNTGEKINRNPEIDHRFFTSDSTDYLIIDHQRIYTIAPDEYALTDVTDEICSRKPALEMGLMTVDFVDKGTGEGFRINTKLGKELFFFPATDVLCTENAFRFMATDNDKGLLPGAVQRVYYLFQNKESSHSSNVARLIEITYLFNNGGPENQLLAIAGEEIRNPQQYRIVSSKPITDEQPCFSPEVLYSDSRNILISSRPTLAPDEVVNIQLLDTEGNSLWTVSFASGFKCTSVVRIADGFVLQTAENSFWEITQQGKKVENYHLK